jgi:hypothetical protein
LHLDEVGLDLFQDQCGVSIFYFPAGPHAGLDQTRMISAMARTGLINTRTHLDILMAQENGQK